MSTIVYGGSLAAMVAVDQLAAAGEQVTFVTPSPRLGGRLGGARLGDARFDTGLVIFENGALNGGGYPDPTSYDPDVCNDCSRFGMLLARYTESLGLVLERIPRLELWSHGRLIPDFIFDTRLDGVRALPDWLQAQATAELTARLASGEHPLHARRKHVEPRYGSLSYETASIANHGAVLHTACFDPFARKVTGRSSADALALHSRDVRLPLFWPEALHDAFRGCDALLPDTPFHVVRGGAVSDLVAALAVRLRESSLVRRLVGSARAVHSDGAGIRLDVDGTPIRGRHLIWGHDLDDLARLTSAAPVAPVERASMAIVLALVARADIANAELGTVIIPEDHALPYRITNQSRNAGVPDESLARISVEWGGADAPDSDDALLALSQSALARIGVTKQDAGFVAHRILRIPGALVLPNAANRDAMLHMRQQVDASGLRILTVAPAAGFAVASLNDQLVQGMRAARLALGAMTQDATIDGTTPNGATSQADGAAYSTQVAA